MIRSLKHRGLKLFFTQCDHKGIPAQYAGRIERILDRLDASAKPEDMNLPGLKWHKLKGARKGSYSVWVSGNWRITYKLDGEDAVDVDLEDYH